MCAAYVYIKKWSEGLGRLREPRLMSLVSNENFSETLWPSDWALGQATAKMTKMTLKLLHL